MASTGPVSAWKTSTQFLGYAFSTDWGATWTPAQAVYAPISGHRVFDPAVAVDAANDFHVSFLTIDMAYASYHVYAATAPAGTTSLGTPAEVTDPVEGVPTDAGPALYTYDKPWISVTKGQEIVVTYTRFDQGCAPDYKPSGACFGNIMAARSTDAQSWTRVALTANNPGGDGGADGGIASFVGMAFQCASTATGRLWVVYEDLAPYPTWPAPAGIALQYSDDDGATWSAPTIVAPIAATVIFDDPSCAGDGSDVWVAYEQKPIGGTVASAIQVVHSTSGGQSFGAPVNALDTAASTYAWHSTLVREGNGHLDVEYYGGLFDGAANGSVYSTHSGDQGATWGPATGIRMPITLTSAGFDVGWLGDYLGVAVGGGALYTAFTDNATGVSHVDFAKATLPGGGMDAGGDAPGD
jgi:hypothetical protein